MPTPSYPALSQYPATGPLTGPVRQITDASTGIKVTLSGPNFVARIQISNATPSNEQAPHLFSPSEDSWDTIAEVGPLDPPTTQQALTRYVRIILVSGMLTGGDIAESRALGGQYGAPQDLRQIAEGVVTPQVATVRSQLANTLLTDLAAKNQAAGPQFVDGSRWLWQASGTPDGGTIIAATGGGVWAREIPDGRLQARWFGVKGDGSDESALIRQIFERTRGTGLTLAWHRPPAFYNCGATGVTVSNVGADYTVEIHPAAQFKATAPTADHVVSFRNVTDGFTLRGGAYSWSTLPTERGGACALRVTGTAITNCVVEGFRVTNSRNFAVWVQALAGSGSHTVRVSGLMSANTLGDGVHVENFDYGITVSDIQVENSGDDAVAVTQFTGSGPGAAETNYTPATDVTVTNISSRNPTFAVIKLQGVSQAAVSNVTATGGTASAAAVLFQFNSAAGYDVPNTNIVVTNCTAHKVQNVFSTAASSLGKHSGYHFSHIRVTGITGDGIYLTGASAANADMGEVSLSDISLTATGTAGRGLFASQVSGLKIRDVKLRGFGKTTQASNCADVDIDGLEDMDPSAARDGIQLDGNKRLRYARLIARDTQTTPKLARGLVIVGNTDVRGRGGCEVVGNTGVAVAGGSNVNVSGYLDEVEGLAVLGNVSAGTASTVTYRRPVLTGGANSVGLLTVTGDPAGKWVGRNLGNAQTEVVWGDNINGVTVHYLIRGQLI